MRISGRLLRGENHNPPFFKSILLSVRVAGEKKAAVYAKLHNRPKGQGEGVCLASAKAAKSSRQKKKGRREKSQRPFAFPWPGKPANRRQAPRVES